MSDITSNVARGHKANLNNPNTSEESKQHSREVLEDAGADSKATEHHIHIEGDKNPANVAGGLKAAINNPNVSEEAKEEAQERLEGMK